MLLYYFRRNINLPVKEIIGALNNNEEPSYKGIHEFEFLSTHIASMIISLQNKSRQAEAANRIKSDFLATMSHEIRSSQSKVLDHNVPIIAMTANEMKGDREKCLAVGMDDYIPKPIHPEKLLKVIEKWLIKTNEGGQSDGLLCNIEPVNTIFDRSGLIDRLSGDKDLAAEILDGFMADASHKFNTLKKALDNADVRLIRQQAHSLKGASANVGAMELEKIACQIDLAGKAKDLIKAGSLISELDNHLETLKKSLVSGP